MDVLSRDLVRGCRECDCFFLFCLKHVRFVSLCVFSFIHSWVTVINRHLRSSGSGDQSDARQPSDTTVASVCVLVFDVCFTSVG